MKAQISELWNTGIDILTNDEGISTIADLRLCDNVIVGDKTPQGTEIIIGECCGFVAFRQASHPSGAGEVIICEFYPN